MQMKNLIYFIFLSSVLSFSSAFAKTTDNSLSLQGKLDQQWENYNKARETLLQQVQKTNLPIDQRLISRQDWEELISLDEKTKFTKQDIGQLKKRHADLVRQSVLVSKRKSTIDLEIVRSKKLSKLFCEQVPKGGMLHIHPFGTLDRYMAKSLLHANNPILDFKEIFEEYDKPGNGSMIYSQEREWLDKNVSGKSFKSLSASVQNQFEDFLFLPFGKQPFARFNAVFDFLGFAIADWDNYENALLSFARKAKSMGVLYVEFTTGVGTNLIQRMQKIEMETGLIVRGNQSFNRATDIAEIDQSLTKFFSQPESKYVVGIDFLDNEEINPALEKGQLLYGTVLHKYLNGKTTLRRTMHSGELGDIRNPRDAMIMGVDRLGHGLNLIEDPVALEYARIHKMPIEINLSSNLRLTSVQSIKKHPFLHYLRLGLPVSLSTDDEGIFEIDINHECEIAINETDMNYAEYKKMAFNSIETAFASDSDKKQLREKLEALFKSFEQSFRN
jgi:adenosine deaminase CECR1